MVFKVQQEHGAIILLTVFQVHISLYILYLRIIMCITEERAPYFPAFLTDG
jgi:hypothetical protein